MTEKIKTSFMEHYRKAGIRVVPGHWPDFQTKQEVDQWLKVIKVLTAHMQEECAACESQQI